MSSNNAQIMGHILGRTVCIVTTSIEVMRFFVIIREHGSNFLSHMHTLTDNSICLEVVIDPDYKYLNNSMVLVSSDCDNYKNEKNI